MVIEEEQNDIFEDYEEAHLETLDLDDEERKPKDKPLGRDYERESGFDAHDTEREELTYAHGEVDIGENGSRNHDYESIRSVRIGGEGELDISRVDVDARTLQGTAEHGPVAASSQPVATCLTPVAALASRTARARTSTRRRTGSSGTQG